jgi:hypothetical protein
VRSAGPHIFCYALCAALFALTFAGATPRLKLMSVAEIRPGMRGYGLTVLRGTEPERFDIEVIDVLHNFRPDQDLVLIKTPHPLLDHAGSVAGMSGSPIYIDERLVGAYAYGWSFGKDPIAGVTPIATMLKELDRPLRPLPFLKPLPAEPRAAAAAREPHRPRDAFWALSQWTHQHPKLHAGSLQAAATPLLVGGMPRGVADVLREKLEPLGLSVLEAAGGGNTKQAKQTNARYVDGGAIAVTLLRGDVQATGVGTVTYVDGKRLLGFGHPMLDAGEARLPTATARVLHVLASERSSFKIAEAISPLGALVHDRQSAIVVDSDVPAETIPVQITLRGVPEAPRSVWNVEAASHRLLTSSLILSAISSALGAAVNDMSELAYRADTTVVLRKYGAQRVVEDGFSTLGLAQPAALSRLRLFDLIDISFANPFELAHIERINVELDLRFARDVIELVGARLAESEIDPGVPARVVLTLRAFDGQSEQRVVEVPLPSTLAGEQVEIELLPGNQARLEQPVPQNFADLLRIAKSGLPSTSLVINVQRKGRGVSLASHVLKNLPSSALDLLLPSRDTARATTFVSEERTVMPLGKVLVGQAKLSLEVRKEKR